MSEEKHEDKPEENKDEKNDLIERNVSLVMAENKRLKDYIAEQDAEIEELKQKLAKAVHLIEQDTKAGLIAEILKLSDYDEQLLAAQDTDTLDTMLKHLKRAKPVTIRSATPITSKKDEVDMDPARANMQKWMKN